MKHYVLLLTVSLCCCAGMAQTLRSFDFEPLKTGHEVIHNNKEEALLRLARRYVAGRGIEQSYEKAFKIYSDLAKENIAEAINAKGIMYRFGKGVEKNIPEAISLFSKAAELGYPQAYYNLGLITCYCEEVDQDFAKAFDYFMKGAEAGYPGCYYQVGYLLSKGLGVIQSYEEAAAWFAKGAERGRASCIYMLGVFYQNGYGVKCDWEKGTRLIEQAALLGYNPALESMLDENRTALKSTVVKSASQAEKEKTVFREITKQVQADDISGSWEGKLITYDYSGKRIEKEEDLELFIDNSGGKVQGFWLYDELEFGLEGNFRDNRLTFVDAGGLVFSYKEPVPIEWTLKSASIEVNVIEEKTYLMGNLNMYSPTVMEPGKPTMIIMQRARDTALDMKLLGDKVQTRMFIYPNPVKEEAIINFTLKEGGWISLSLWGVDGVAKGELISGTYPAGTHTRRFKLNLPSGNYIVLLQSGQEKRTQILMIK